MPIVHAADLKVHYEEAGHGTEIVVLVHGEWSTWRCWQPLLARLPAARYHSYALDQRGCGQTEGPDNDYTILQRAGDLAAFTRVLNLRPVHLVGQSLGAAVATQYALDHPRAVKTLTLSGPPPVQGALLTEEALQAPAQYKEDKQLLIRALRAMAPTVRDEAFFQALVDDAFSQRLQSAMKNGPALMGWNVEKKVSRLPVPTLIVRGELDVVVSQTNVERATHAFAQARLETIPRVGHCLATEAPEQVALLFLAHTR
ncbi:MAG: alpha/beta hydrolase [Anaerolineae bacterium]|nr:alpha/beta hydrolase [Anaerolineae bacterium]